MVRKKRKDAHEAIKPIGRFVKKIWLLRRRRDAVHCHFSPAEGRRSVLPARYPDPFTGPVPGSILNADPFTGNPFTAAVIVCRIPCTLICWRDPDFFICPMSVPTRRWRWVTIGICGAIPGMTARVEDSATNDCRTDADSHTLPSIMLSASRPCR